MVRARRRMSAALGASITLLLCLAAGHAVLSADAPRMEIVEGKDVTGQVFKRLGLPNQNYCWEQCLQEERCKATRWGFIEGATAGQCQFLTGELTFGAPREIKTEDGQRIIVVVSKKSSVQ
jgi:hypothetical protein